MDEHKDKLNDEAREAWNANAEFWDQRMGDGNDFVEILQWPSILRLLKPSPGQKILDISTGNGLTARKLSALKVSVTAFDFSTELIRLAKGRSSPTDDIDYRVMDATDPVSLRSLGEHIFDAALCNMALFDMADITPLFQNLPFLLRPGGIFVFTLTHPAFNNTSAVHAVEEMDDRGEIKTIYSIKVSRYMTSMPQRGLAMRDQPRPHIYFDRPLQVYFNLGFQNGFVLDGFEERAFPSEHPQKNPLAWGGKYSEIPPVLVARMRLVAKLLP